MAKQKFVFRRNLRVKIHWKKLEKSHSFDENKAIQEIYEPCLYPFSNMMINPQGDVYPCLSVKIGNVREKMLKKSSTTQNTAASEKI